MANKDNEKMSSLLLSFLNFLTRSSTPSRSNRSALCPVGRVPAGGPERGFRRHSSPLSKAGGDWQPSPTTKKTRIQPRSRLRRLFLSLLWQHGEAEEGPVIGGYGFDRIEGGQDDSVEQMKRRCIAHPMRWLPGRQPGVKRIFLPNSWRLYWQTVAVIILKECI